MAANSWRGNWARAGGECTLEICQSIRFFVHLTVVVRANARACAGDRHGRGAGRGPCEACLAGPMCQAPPLLALRAGAGCVRPMVGAGQAKFWLKLHNPVTSFYKVERGASVKRVERVSGSFGRGGGASA